MTLPFIIDKESLNFSNVSYLIDKHGICVIEDFFSQDFVERLFQESKRILHLHKDLIDILDKEDCSKDERIFNAQDLSPTILDFSEIPFFKDIALKFGKSLRLNTLLNRLVYEEGLTKNSGAGWHRDNHHCQFKVIVYLTDVTIFNGNFQWITNSSHKFIGYPEPRSEDYNTRFSDEVIHDIIINNPTCELIDIIGKKGTVILADTTYIHRGNIIKEGERYALTQYFF